MLWNPSTVDCAPMRRTSNIGQMGSKSYGGWLPQAFPSKNPGVITKFVVNANRVGYFFFKSASQIWSTPPSPTTQQATQLPRNNTRAHRGCMPPWRTPGSSSPQTRPRNPKYSLATVHGFFHDEPVRVDVDKITPSHELPFKV